MAATPSGMVKATLNYFLEPEDGGDHELVAGTVGEKRRKYCPTQVHIKDIRGHENKFTLDKNGFQLVEKACTEKTFDNQGRIKETYYPEVAELIKECTGATTVIPMSHLVRQRSWNSAFEAEKDLPDDARTVGPSNARFVHCDQSYKGARLRITDTLPECAAKLDKCRWAIINLWRPFDHTVTRDALAVADFTSIREDELRDVTFRQPKRRDSALDSTDPQQVDQYVQPGETPSADVHGLQCAAPKTPDQHQWWYASEMKPDEALLLKICDSRRDVANMVMHTSFAGEHDYGRERHSLELRCAVFWEDQSVE